MTKWLLKVELNGEWEECAFATHDEALATFSALAADYDRAIARAVLFRDKPQSSGPKPLDIGASVPKHLLN